MHGFLQIILWYRLPLFCLTLFILTGQRVHAQSELVIDSILVTGNKKTKERIILREMTISTGDTITLLSIQDEFAANRLRLMNTGLFTSVLFNIKSWDLESGNGIVSVEVVEAWYVFPIPTFELADRNFNVWWVDYEHSLRRVNYGFNLYYSNVTGRLDYLKVKTQLGFTRKLELEYTLPYINRAQTLGVSLGLLHTRNKAVNFATLEDKQQFHGPFDDGPDLLRRTRAKIGLRYRPGLRFLHVAELAYQRNTTDPQILSTLNPFFFLSGEEQRFLSLEYDISYDSRDVIAYPTRGIFAFANFRKEGLGVWDDLNQLYLTARFQPYFSMNEHWSFGFSAEGRVALNRARQPFYNSRALGYEESYVRGYEYYVIDGLDYGLFKTDVRWNFLDRSFNWGNLMPVSSLRIMSLDLFLNAFVDLGYANNPYYAYSNRLANRLLTGYGIGLDIVAYFNKLVQIQLSRNHLGETGLYLSWKLTF